MPVCGACHVTDASHTPRRGPLLSEIPALLLFGSPVPERGVTALLVSAEHTVTWECWLRCRFRDSSQSGVGPEHCTAAPGQGSECTEWPGSAGLVLSLTSVHLGKGCADPHQLCKHSGTHRHTHTDTGTHRHTHTKADIKPRDCGYHIRTQSSPTTFCQNRVQKVTESKAYLELL